jgi:hypothetical protein
MIKGSTHSIETKKKISNSNRGKKAWNKGKIGIFSEESKKKISDGLREYYKKHPVSEEERKKRSLRIQGKNHPMYGKHHTKYARQEREYLKQISLEKVKKQPTGVIPNGNS